MVELRREQTIAEILHPQHDFRPTRTRLEIRWDPLTGHTSRLLPDSGLLPSSDFDLRGLGRDTQATCPFCSDRMDRLTPKFPAAISAAGRIQHGEAVLFPNLLPYSKYSSVCVYSPDRHFLPLAQMTPELITDNVAAQVEFARAVMRWDSDAGWASINANHMLPSGSSIFHPHTQGGVNPTPTTLQRLLSEVPEERVRDYLDTERKLGERYLGSTGGVEWVAGFAPVGPAELRAFLPGVASPIEMARGVIEELGWGIATALNLYAELGFESFNMALYGAPPNTQGYALNLRMVCRSNFSPLYRSDATWLERLHWEGAVDISPEEIARRASDRFRIER